MKIIFLTNNDISLSLVNWLRNNANEEVKVLNENISRETIERYKPDLIVSYNYRYLIRKDVLDLLPNRVINLHISLLPWNRGAHPNLWSFLEGTPKGVTIHLIDEGIDTGDILLQKEVHIDEAKETLSSSYKILNKEIQKLFISNWNKIKNLQIVKKPQPSGGSIHYIKDFEKIKPILGIDEWDIQIIDLKKRFKNNLSEAE